MSMDLTVPGTGHPRARLIVHRHLGPVAEWKEQSQSRPIMPTAAPLKPTDLHFELLQIFLLGPMRVIDCIS